MTPADLIVGLSLACILGLIIGFALGWRAKGEQIAREKRLIDAAMKAALDREKKSGAES